MARRDERRRAQRLIGGAAGAVAAIALGLAGCGGGGGHSTADAAVDAMGPPPWWQPKVGEAKNWDIQLSGTIDVSMPRLMYDLDLWALVPAPTMLDYGDGMPVTVPAGALAGKIAELHARTPPAKVICHVETGALEPARPDAKKFPADVQKGTVPGLTGAKFLDVSATGRAKWAAIMFKRFDLAKQIGCDGIEPAHNDVASYISGFTISAEDSYSWYAEVAKQGHMRELSTGMKDGDLLGGQIDASDDKFDWLMIERCGEFQTCDTVMPFLTLHKAVFAIDYNRDVDGNVQSSEVVCQSQRTPGVADGIFKDVALTSAVWTSCSP